MSATLVNHIAAGSLTEDTYPTTSVADMTGATILIISITGQNRNYPTPLTYSVSDSLGNVYTALTQYGSTSSSGQLFYCLTPTVSSAMTFSVSVSGPGASGYTNIYVDGFSGGAFSLDTSIGANNVATTIAQPGSITPAFSGELFITFVGNNGDGSAGGSNTIDSGFTVTDSFPNNGGVQDVGAMAYAVNSGSGALNPTWTVTVGTPNCAGMVAFISSTTPTLVNHIAAASLTEDTYPTTSVADMTGATILIISITGQNLNYPTPLTYSVSDSLGNVYTALTQYGSEDTSGQLFYCLSPTVGSVMTFSVGATGPGASGFTNIYVEGFSGGTFSLDTSIGANNVATTIAQPGSITPAFSGELFMTFVGIDGRNSAGGSNTIDSGFTVTDSLPNNGGVQDVGAMAYAVNSGSGALNPTWTVTVDKPSFPSCAGMAAFILSTPPASGKQSIAYINSTDTKAFGPRIISTPRLGNMKTS